MFALFLWMVGRLAEAREQMEQAVALDPLSVLARYQLAGICLSIGDAQGMERQVREATSLDPGSPMPHWIVAWSRWQRGETAEAVAAFERARELGGGRRTGLALSWAYAKTGRRQEAHALLEEVTAGAEGALLSPVELAAVRAALDEPREARALLERALTEGDDHLVAWGVSPLLADLRSDPAFQDVGARIGLW
jgi:tetratricopeptide (TPR) repeat protein